MSDFLLTLVIPCYNEEKRLPVDELGEYADANKNIRLLLVDDGSSDGTLGLLERFVEAHPENSKFLHLAHNRGKAEAVREGFLTIAADAKSSDLIGFWDADLATPLDEIKCFLDVFAGRPDFKTVVGSRWARMGAHIERRASRHIIGRVISFIINEYLGFAVYDSQCGAKMFRTSEVEYLFREPFVSRWLFDVEILKRMAVAHGKEWTTLHVCEMPLAVWNDVPGSKLKFYHACLILRELVRIAFHYHGK
ncbi:MAG: glycosyltransferase [Victivallaceae bacterium]|nr:glycosyltransferase [Victivallaceae bacterium]